MKGGVRVLVLGVEVASISGKQGKEKINQSPVLKRERSRRNR
jgi:hypothetical protein